MRPVLLYKPDANEMRLRPLSAWGWIALLPVLLGLVVIRLESSEIFTFERTSAWTRPLWQGWFGAMNEDAWQETHLLMRKVGHLTGYGLLTLTFMRSWLLALAYLDRGRQLTLSSWRFRACRLALASTVVVALCDELHQTTLPGRTGKASDVLIDTAGGLLFLGAFWLFYWRPRRWEREI